MSLKKIRDDVRMWPKSEACQDVCDPRMFGLNQQPAPEVWPDPRMFDMTPNLMRCSFGQWYLIPNWRERLIHGFVYLKGKAKILMMNFNLFIISLFRLTCWLFLVPLDVILQLALEMTFSFKMQQEDNFNGFHGLNNTSQLI